MWIFGDEIIANKPSLNILAALIAKDVSKKIWCSRQACYAEAGALLRQTEDILKSTEEAVEVYPPLLDSEGEPVTHESGEPILDFSKPAKTEIHTVTTVVQAPKGNTWRIEDNYFVVSSKDGTELCRWELELLHDPAA